MTRTNKPAHEVRIGRIKATIWANPTEQAGLRYGVTVSRLYKDQDGAGEWKSSESFGRDDLLTLAKVLDLAHTWIHQQREES